MNIFKFRSFFSIIVMMTASSSFASRQEILDCQLKPAIDLSVRSEGGEQVIEDVEQFSIKQLANRHYADVVIGKESAGIVSYSRSTAGRLISITAWQAVLSLKLKPLSESEVIDITEKQNAFTAYQGEIHTAPNSTNDQIISQVTCQFRIENY